MEFNSCDITTISLKTFHYYNNINSQARLTMFGKLLQGSNDADENILMEMEQQLREGIQKAKGLSLACKMAGEGEEVQFMTNAQGELIYPDFKSDVNYNEQFWKTYLKNELSFSMIKEYSEKTATLQQQVENLEHLQQQYFKLYKIKNRKKNRRLAVEIQKNFTCPYDRCYKIYGSDVSLNLHIKLKHNGGNKTDREKLAEEICRAELKGEQPPQMRLNLPPGYLQEFKKAYLQRKQQGIKKQEEP